MLGESLALVLLALGLFALLVCYALAWEMFQATSANQLQGSLALFKPWPSVVAWPQLWLLLGFLGANVCVYLAVVFHRGLTRFK